MLQESFVMLQEVLILPQKFIVAASVSANTGANALTQMGFRHLLVEMMARPADYLASWIVSAVLLIMSVMSLYWMVFNVIKAVRLKSRGNHVVNAFWQAKTAQEAIDVMEKQPASEPFSKIALDAAQAAAHYQRVDKPEDLGESLSRSEFVDRALRRGVTRESAGLQSGMILLATVGATAPFVGLLGTVVGIYNALIRIGATGQASIDAVAGPVGEALIMTAFGLFVAIPAVFAYNFFNKMNSATIVQFDTFAHDLHDFFATGARVQ